MRIKKTIIKLFNFNLEKEALKYLNNNSYDIKLFFILFILNVFIYGQKIFFYTLSCDDYDRFYLNNNTLSLISQSGRWAQVLLNTYIFQNKLHVLPYIHGVFGIFSFTLVGFLSAKYFKLIKTLDISIVTILISVSPMVGQNLLFTTNITAWVTFALGVIGFLLVHKHQILIKLLGVLLIVFSIGSYQSIIQIIFVLIIIKALVLLLNANTMSDIKSLLLNSIHVVLFSLLAVFISVKINHWFLIFYDMGVSSRMANVQSVLDITLFKKMYTQLPQFDHFSILFYGMYGAVCILFFLAIMHHLIFSKKQKHIKYFSFILTLIALFLLPIILNIPLIVQKIIPLRAYIAIIVAIAGFYAIQIMIFKGIFKVLSNLIVLIIIILSMYYNNIFFDTSSRQVQADINRANMMVKRIRSHENYSMEPLKLNIYGIKSFPVTGWKPSVQEPFTYPPGQYKIIKYFTDLKFQRIGYNYIEDVIDYLVQKGEQISSYPGKNSVVVYQDKAVIFLDARYANKRINTAKFHKSKPDVHGVYDLYLQNNILFYKKTFCTKDDKSDFKLQLFPDIEYEKKYNHKDYAPINNLNIRFNDYGMENNGTCIVAKVLPKYKLRKIVTGQYGKKGDFQWKETISFEDENSTKFSTNVKVKNPSKGIHLYIEKYQDKEDFIEIGGWAFIEKNLTEVTQTFLVVKGNGKTYIVKTYPAYRLDVADVFKNDKLKYSGFNAKIFKKDFPKGEYTIGLLSMSNNKQFFSETKRQFVVK